MRRGGVVVWVVAMWLNRAVAAEIGPCVGLASEGVAVEPQLADVSGSHVQESWFGHAPVEWLPLAGHWDRTGRWDIAPDPKLLGGWSTGLCALSSKRGFEGDLAVEAYVSFRYDLPWADDNWWCQPNDLNITFAARAGDLASGPSFIYSGRNGGATLIRYGTQVLAQTTRPEDVVPSFTDRNPVASPRQHNQETQFDLRWWRLLARRSGDTLSLTVDDRKLLECRTDQPAEPVHVVLWTVNSGFVVARTRIYYSAAPPTVLPLRIAREPALPR